MKKIREWAKRASPGELAQGITAVVGLFVALTALAVGISSLFLSRAVESRQSNAVVDVTSSDSVISYVESGAGVPLSVEASTQLSIRNLGGVDAILIAADLELSEAVECEPYAVDPRGPLPPPRVVKAGAAVVLRRARTWTEEPPPNVDPSRECLERPFRIRRISDDLAFFVVRLRFSTGKELLVRLDEAARLSGA